MKRGLLSIAMLLALPSFASAAFNCWSVTRGVMPAERATTLVAPADDALLGIKTVGNITYVQAANGQACATAPTELTFTLTPPAGQAPVVKVDGLTKTTPTVGVANTYTVSKGTKITHTINATYAATATQVSITTIGAAGGYISPSKKIAYNSDTTVTITPAAGFTVTGVKINGALDAAALTEIGADGGDVSLNDVTAATTVSAVFTQTPTLVASIATANATLTIDQVLNLKGSAAVNMSTTVPTYAWSVTPATGATFGTPNAANTTFTATAAGTYVVTLTVADAAKGLTDTESRTITVQTAAAAGSNVCASCHTVRDAGLSAAYAASTHANNPYHLVSCADCHNPAADANHPFALELAAAACYSCHSQYLQNHTAATHDVCITCHRPHGLSPVAGSIAAMHTTPVASGADCAACHTAHNAGVAKAQYVGEGIVCANCHAGSNAAILGQWAESGHADVNGAWSHEEAGSTCSRCHTTSGYVANLTNGGSYSYPNAEDLNKLQVLACNACHVDLAVNADRRAATAFTATWSNGGVTATVTYPSVGESNQCVRCHSARRAGPNITSGATTTAHYLPVAAVLFGGTTDMVAITANTSTADAVPVAVGTKYTGGGYEFAGRSYGNLGFHKNIDKAGKGACVACHMGGTAGHTWEAVTKDEAGVITAINSSACASCHSGLTVAELNASKTSFTTAVNALDAALQAKGVYFYNGSFYGAAYDTTEGATNTSLTAAAYATKATAAGVSTKDLMGAAYNLWLFKYDGADPAAYVHNKQYAMKLITDSIDLINDGTIDGDSGVAVTASAIDGHGTGLGTTTATTVGLSVAPAANVITATCASCHSATNFVSSQHANKSPRAAACAACHSHEGFVARAALGKSTTNAELVEDFNGTAFPELFALPAQTSTIVGVSTKNCTTCHDSANGNALRGPGAETVVEGTIDNSTSTAVRTKYSAEFNLCTACHMVDLVETWDTTEGYTEMGMFKYTLSPNYTAAGLLDQAGTTNDFNKVFYHDGVSGTGRMFIDTHFGGTIAEKLVVGITPENVASTTDVTLKGYNINPGNKNACTICHDPHTAGKMLAVNAGTTVPVDDNNNAAVSFATGLGDFHTDYLSDVFSRGSVTAQSADCSGCHNGQVLAAKTQGIVTTGTQKWEVVGCNTCHNLDKPNTVAGTNDAVAFDDVRQFPAGYEFKFNSAGSAAVPLSDLGDNAICFECHKGRIAGVDVSQLPAGETQNYTISYLHYAPSMAILYGNDSKMVATYSGKSYSGRFQHPVAVNGKTNFSCTDCHNVHTGANVMASAACNSCHVDGTAMSSHDLAARTQAFSERLLDTVLAAMIATPSATDATLAAKLVEIKAATTIEAQRDILMTYIETRQVKFPSVAIAHAAVAWKVFTYEDGPLHGQAHGHGGSWAHNSKFARQVMYDAIESLGGDLTGLTRPTL